MKCVIIKLLSLILIGTTASASAHELRGYSDSSLPSNQVMIDESEERIRRDYGGYNNGYRAPGREYTDKGQPRYRHSNSNPSGWKKTSAAKREDQRARERRARDNGNYNPNRNYNGPYYNGKKYYHNNRNYYNGCCWWEGECRWSHCSQGDEMNDFQVEDAAFDFEKEDYYNN